MTTMYDSIDNTQYPPGAAAYAAYVDGGLASQPNYAWIVGAFPDAHHLSIALDPSHDADALDIEEGAAPAAAAPPWIARQKARGIARPVLYADAYEMDTEVLPVLAAAGISRGSVRLWTAHYGEGEHICGPKTCGQLSVDADGTQWDSAALGRDLDQSLLLDDFFGAPAPHPVHTQEADVQLPVIKQGDTGQAVRNLQGLLIAHGYGYLIAPEPGPSIEDRSGVDGDCGARTATAVARFQEAKKLPATGITDGKTWAALLGQG